MPLVDNIIPEPLSNASTFVLSSNQSQKEPESTTTNTQLEQGGVQKVVADVSSRRACDSSSLLSNGMPGRQYRNGQDEMVQFKGLYIVRGPTEPKHVRYTMEIAVAELKLRGRCIQRFNSFFQLRKCLLEVLKTCRGRLLIRKNTLPRVDNEPLMLAGAELMKILTRPRGIQCSECKSTFDQLAAVNFPRRTLFPPESPRYSREI
ncbi:unnamed protein product [Peronospora belbahrii]|uniref:PX domain-containing protein n=1 Tax=Peronospora belbahrii TaxID=622444 RepID=A0AAU9LQA1_9STRA|nr:unnamed protein product [Peronospora belbahrii]